MEPTGIKKKKKGKKSAIKSFQSISSFVLLAQETISGGK